MSYYNGINPDLLVRIPATARRVLEIGCGEGRFAEAFLNRQPQARYDAIELFAKAALKASKIASHVVCGDIELVETLEALDNARQGQLYDTLILGDVLEHLKNPWRVLAELRMRTAPGATCVACIPNVSHWSVIQSQLQGQWSYADSGLLDKTHLRFFTLDSAIELFRTSGWQVLDATPRNLWADKTATALQSLLPLAEILKISRTKMQRDLSAYQWIVRAVNGPLPKRLHVAGLGMKKVGGVTEARIDYPLATLNSLPSVRAIWSSESLMIPDDFEPGIFVLHRQFMNDARFIGHIDRLIAKGWVIVTDMDDDPRRWEEFKISDFRAFRGVHAVTVSTHELAELVRQWNPNVYVLPNAVFELPSVVRTTPTTAQPLRIFIGAFNRSHDWTAIQEPVIQAALELGHRVKFVILHDQSIHDSLPDSIDKEFHATMSHQQYMQLLANCDIALLPLNDNEFNRYKSDLKLIESIASGVVPICSPVVYANDPQHENLALIARTPSQWYQALRVLCSNEQTLQQLRQAGLEYVKKERMHSAQAINRQDLYTNLLITREKLELQRAARLQNQAGFTAPTA